MFFSGVTVEASFFGLVVAGYRCRGAVLQTEQYNGGGAVLQQYSGVGLSAAVAGWGCFAVAICYTLQILAMTKLSSRREEMELCPGLSVQFYFVCY